MGTTQKTDQSNKYDPGSMAAFQQATPAWMKPAQGFASNPYGNPQFQFEQQMGTRNAMNQNQTNMNQLFQNQRASGFGGGVQSPFMQEMLANQMRGNTANTALQGFISPTQMANQRQQSAMAMLESYRPLQTGSSQVQSTGGLGTWLPQVAGMGLGLATGGMSGLGGLGGLFGGGGGFNYGGANAANMGFNMPNNSWWGAGGGGPAIAPDMGMPSWLGGMGNPGIGPGSGGGGYGMPGMPMPGLPQ